MTVEIWTFRAETLVPRSETEPPELSGYEVHATDGEVGTVTDATYERGRSFVAVDTGPWILGKTVLLPAGTIERVDHEERRVYVARTKEQIKDAPPLALEDRTPEDEEALGIYYGGHGGS